MMTKKEKFNIFIRSMKTTLRNIANGLYLVMFAIITMVSILGTTQFDIPWGQLIENGNKWGQIVYDILFSPQMVLLIIVVFQYLCSDCFDWKEYAICTVICLLAFQMAESNGGGALQTYILLVIGARKFPFRRLMMIYFILLTAVLLVTIVGSQLGWVENLLYPGREGRIALGFIYPTDCAAHFLFWALCYWYLRNEKISYIEIGVFFLLAMAAWFGCKARFSTALLVLTGGMAIVYKRMIEKAGNSGKTLMLQKVLSAVLVTVPLISNLIIHILSIMYNEDWGWMKVINQIVTSRLSLAKRGIDIYGFSLWGSNIPMIGNGSEVGKRLKYYYIDSSYMRISMLHGMVILGVILLLFTMACFKAWKEGEWILLMILSTVALHAVFEHHAFELAYSPFLLSVLTNLQVPAFKRRKKTIWLRKRNAYDKG